MERKQSNTFQNLDETKSEILKKRLLKSSNISASANQAQNNNQQNVVMNNLRAPITSSMIVSTVHGPQSSIPITHNLVTHSIAPVKLHANTASYPLQLSTVHVPVQIPGSTSNINLPMQLSTSLQLANPSVSLPLQVSTSSVPIQISQGDTINMPMMPGCGQNIQLTGTLPSMPLLQTPNQQLHSSIIHLHMNSNTRVPIDGSTEMTVSNTPQITSDSGGMQVKLNSQPNSVQMGSNPAMVQIPNSSSNSIQLTLPANNASGSAVQLQRGQRVPHMVYIQTPTGLKPVSNSEVITQSTSAGVPPQIIVRRQVSGSAGNIHLISNMPSKANIAPKPASQVKPIITAGNASQPIVIQKPKGSDKMMVPVSISSGTGKPAIAYLGPVKKSAAKTGEQSIILPNTTTINHNNQKLYITPMPKIQNTKFILPVTAAMATKGPIINLQIANGQIQNDPQGNITVMRDTGGMDTSDMPPLQPLNKVTNGKEVQIGTATSVPQSPKIEKAPVNIHGSRAESTGEQEYTLSIPETNASMNDDDVYTVSIADEEGQTREKSFTLAIPEKGKSLLNNRNEVPNAAVPAPAILRRSNSDNCERKNANINLKRRISLCNENLSNKNFKFTSPQKFLEKVDHQEVVSDDHRVPSLFCDEKLDKDLEAKNVEESDPEDYKDSVYNGSVRSKRDSRDSLSEEDPPGLLWNNGVAALFGSNIQFQTNEFGMIDLIDHSDQEDQIHLNHTSKYQTPLKQRIDRSGRDKKPTSPEDLYRCDGCGCHGMAAEFITPNFCSLTCQNEVHKIIQKKKDKERSDFMRKRNKIKKLLMRKQVSESDLMLGEPKDDKVPLQHYESAPADSRLSESSIMKMNEELIENEKYPWMCGKNGFSWMRYLEFCKAKAAPVKLFKDPFPYNRNGFKVGMKMEAIDPQYPSYFCVVTVAEVQGYRMRLHFDEYPDVYDFWVNVDSVDIFPAGWCEKNGRVLKPPASFTGTGSTFYWPAYLKQTRSVTAPRHLFPHLRDTMVKTNGFRTGMKLEADDRKNNLICVATISDMMDNRMLINFDSWDEMYDYWVEPTSPYIHPVGWAEANGIALTPPHFYKDPESFSWENYLIETGSAAAPARAFKTRPPQGFRVGMKLEVVDKRVPFLIRVATISAVKDHQVRVSSDGWPDELAYWLDDDSPDIHPVGWCLKTGHPLEPPLTAEELSIPGGCGVGGCRGLGSARGGPHKTHASASACPYRAAPPPPRLAADSDADAANTRRVAEKTKPAHTPTSDTSKEKLPRGRPPKHKRVEEIKPDPASEDESVASSGDGKRWRSSRPSARDVEASVTRAAPPPPPPSAERKLRVDLHIADLHLPDAPTKWTLEEVRLFAARVAGGGAGAAAAAARLSGAELLMASRRELVECARMRLGPAIKLYAAVKRLRETVAAT